MAMDGVDWGWAPLGQVHGESAQGRAPDQARVHSELCSGDTGVRCSRPKWGKEDLHASNYRLRGWLWSRPLDS